MLSAMKDSYQAVGIYNQGSEFISPVGQGEEIGKAFLQKRCLGSDSRVRISQTKKKKMSRICDSPEAGRSSGKLGEDHRGG